ncbi:MAG TPA: hypothetical protein VM553_11880 [Dongiaceae bacterium]|nr:hypothetical protein [Dongiaceae bacterium]
MLTLKLQETMSGWIERNVDHKQEPLRFSIDVIFLNRSQPWQAQPFSGVLSLPDRGYETHVQGQLSFKLSGPRYELLFDFPGLGAVELKGEKSYDLFNLKESLTVCPLTLYQDGKAIGYAEVAYRDSILAFPFRALRLVDDAAALGARG